MGQKVNPIGLRIGIIREWDAKQKSGKIIIKYSSNEELERILELIRNDGNE